ncbi:phenylalanine--tRNA ligase subunit beta [Corticibacter populi]|uniref:Phenylalanine--tRNA ligase beta subunit n=1 Tax=Corticibacter populi TaxID=1550736 RepID=A0A3M6QXD9_9BURK|nr:phenylalanine--tRNA ligase subunit beta [Corticibacter populi]RMX07676.1 phenylalanine--tRNA ligase subunit beta [Corticibacter populi]RZS30184.1 phenylalanyl-tRNA synthetase beta subunit [Corticibacter populi]
MQFPESWLREFCNPPLSTQELADTLTMGGFEVEEVAPVAPPFTGIVVGEIKEAVQHPDADRLRVCKVDVGSAGPEGELLQIVCGAPNARVGIKVPCAMVGAELPPGEDGKPFRIKVGKLRGVASHGMLCSARELQLADEHAGLLELPADAPVGQDIRSYLRLDDQVFTLKLTPNLAHGLSIYGVARELAALTGTPLQTPAIVPVAASGEARVAVDVQASDLCGRFSGRVVQGVDTRVPTPKWMVDKLARCGQRSVSPLVDISNFVMFEYGQPSHIFDLDKIHGGLQVRWGRPGEQLKLLNGNTIGVDEQVGVIADEQAVESLAGIMGGDATAVSDETRNIYIEAAFWWPAAIQGRSRRFNFSTDAGHRFERGVDPSHTVDIIERITQLVLQVCGTPQTRVGAIDDQVLSLPRPQPVALRVARAAKVIGMPVSAAQCEDALRRLDLPYAQETAADGGPVLVVMPPPHRFDIQIEADLIEEVARIIGFNALPDTPPLAPVMARIRPEASRSKFAVRHLLAELGYQETINFSFVEAAWEAELAGNAEPIRLLNPIAAPMSVMRSSLIGSLLGALKYNLDRRASRVRLFEIGRVFLRDASVPTGEATVKGVRQPMRVAGIAYGDVAGRQWGQAERRSDFFDAKGDVQALLAPLDLRFEAAEHPALHPGRSARVLLGDAVIGVVGELHPKWRQQWELPQAPVLFELELDAVLELPVPWARPVARQQLVERDLAIVVSESVSFAQVRAAIDTSRQARHIADVLLFDIYRPQAGQANASVAAGEKSLAIRLTLGDGETVLTDADIDATLEAVVQNLQERLAARLRA